jgi:hypothetical protein
MGSILVGLVALLVTTDLDQADKIASVVGAFVSLIALVVSAHKGEPSRTHRPATPGPDGRDQIVSTFPVDATRVSTHRRSSNSLTIGKVAVITIVAVAGVVLASPLIHAFSQLSASGRGDLRSPGPATPTGIGSPTTTPPAKVAVIPVLWKGEILLDGTPRDFDYEPPRRGNTSSDMSSDGVLYGSTYSDFWGGGVAIWPNRADPNRADCTERLTTHGVREVQIYTQSRLCLLTNQGRIIFIKVLGREGDGYSAEVTIWPGG